MTDIITPSSAQTPEELADLIDQLMAHGSGHINISSDPGADDIRIETVKSTDCSGSRNACCQPTESAVDPDED